MTAISVEPMSEDDAASVLGIYADGIATGHATFQASAPDWLDWSGRHLEECRFVARADGEVAGWVALGTVSSRPVYRGVAESSVYVHSKFRGLGIADALMTKLVTESEAAGFWTLVAGVFPENAASLRLHQRHGFRTMGIRKRIGRMSFGPMAGQWRDVVILERRSTITGVD